MSYVYAGLGETAFPTDGDPSAGYGSIPHAELVVHKHGTDAQYYTGKSSATKAKLRSLQSTAKKLGAKVVVDGAIGPGTVKEVIPLLQAVFLERNANGLVAATSDREVVESVLGRASSPQPGNRAYAVAAYADRLAGILAKYNGKKGATAAKSAGSTKTKVESKSSYTPTSPSAGMVLNAPKQASFFPSIPGLPSWALPVALAGVGGLVVWELTRRPKKGGRRRGRR